MLVSAPRIVFKLEGGAGNKTVPLLVAEITANAELKDWSSQVCHSFTLILTQRETL